MNSRASISRSLRLLAAEQVVRADSQQVAHAGELRCRWLRAIDLPCGNGGTTDPRYLAYFTLRLPRCDAGGG